MTATVLEYQLRSIDATWNYARWEQLPDDGNRYEVIDGVLYMSTSPSINHQSILMTIAQLVGAPLARSGIARSWFAPIGLIMPGADPVQPDFVVVRTERLDIIEGGRIRGVPDLIAEVVSPSNPGHDLVTKRAAYARAGVPEYWIVLPDAQEVIVLTTPNAALGEYLESRVFTLGMDLVSPTLPIRVPVDALFRDMLGSRGETQG